MSFFKGTNSKNKIKMNIILKRVSIFTFLALFAFTYACDTEKSEVEDPEENVEEDDDIVDDTTTTTPEEFEPIYDWPELIYTVNTNYEVYVDPAPGDSAAIIQAAIDEVNSSGGGTVHLSEGTYYISTSIIMKSNVTLLGDPDLYPEQIIITPGVMSFNSCIIASTGALLNVNFYNFTVKGNLTDEEQTLGPEYHEDSLAYNDGNETREDMLGIYFEANGESYDECESQDMHLKGVMITKCSMGFQTKGTRDLLVEDCYMFDNGLIEKYFHNIYLRRVFAATIQNITTAYSSTGCGVNISQSDDVTVRGIHSHDNFWRGLRLYGESGHTFDTICVEDNLLENNLDTGLLLANINSGNVDNNTATGNNPDYYFLGCSITQSGNSWQ